jgi:hypothetical protein
MQPDSKADAQVRADRIGLFWQELERLEREGVAELQPAQRSAIRQHHDGLLADFAARFDIDRSARAHQLSLGMRIASFLGALALAASVYFLALLGAALGSLSLTAFIAGRDASGYFTKLAALVAFACFVLNIAMLGQIFNITPSDKALLPWAALALLLAYRCELRLLLVAGLACMAAYVAARAGTWSGMYWLHFGERPENFFPAAILSFCLPQWIEQRRYPGFAQTYRVFGLLILLLPVLVLSNWGHISYLPWAPSSIEVLYQIAGFALSAGAIWLGVRRGWGETVNTGVVFFVLFLYTKFYDWWWDWMPKWLFFFVLALVAVLLLLVFRRLRTAMSASAAEART